jgi:hypothetical protein
MILLWLVTGVSLATAILAWREARRMSQRLDQLSQMYWALKYQHGELRVQMQRTQSGAPDAGATGATPAPPDRPTDAFVPLSSLKR